MLSLPPDNLPRYRLLTGKDDAAFCHRVSEALALGYQLHGPPALTFNGTDVIVAQALTWPDDENVTIINIPSEFRRHRLAGRALRSLP